MTFEETPTIELKRMYTPALKKEIVAFANTNGGTIYIGVEDDGNVIGVPNAHEVEEAVNALIHNTVVPDLSMFAEAHCEWFDDVELVDDAEVYERDELRRIQLLRLSREPGVHRGGGGQ